MRPLAGGLAPLANAVHLLCESRRAVELLMPLRASGVVGKVWERLWAVACLS